MLESQLRQAMAEETADAMAAPDLTETVVRLSRRRRTRARALSVAAAIALFFTGIAGYFATRPQGRAATSVSDIRPLPTSRASTLSTAGLPLTFEGITVTRLPAGLQLIGPRYDTGTTMVWSDAGRWVHVEVVRGGRAENLDTLKRYDGATSEDFVLERRTTVNGAPALAGRIENDAASYGQMTLWLPRPGYGLRVMVSDDLAVQLPAIAKGIVVLPPPKRGDDEVDVFKLGHIPAGMTRVHDAVPPTDDLLWQSAGGLWRAKDGRELRVDVHRGPGVQIDRL